LSRVNSAGAKIQEGRKSGEPFPHFGRVEVFPEDSHFDENLSNGQRIVKESEKETKNT
jgi:hypothetical protein